jgi:hypothetical protein
MNVDERNPGHDSAHHLLGASQFIGLLKTWPPSHGHILLSVVSHRFVRDRHQDWEA